VNGENRFSVGQSQGELGVVGIKTVFFSERVGQRIEAQLEAVAFPDALSRKTVEMFNLVGRNAENIERFGDFLRENFRKKYIMRLK